MRILRSQYLKYKAQQGQEASTSSKTTTTLASLNDETEVQHTTSKKANGDLKSIQTVTQTTRTTIRRSSIAPLKDNSSRAPYRRNSSYPLNETTQIADNLQTCLPSGQDEINSKCLDAPTTPAAIQQGRQTVACTNTDELLKHQILNALKIKLLNTPCGRYTRINLVVRFYDEGANWYTRFYRSYQNTLWLKIPRTDGGNKKQKWYFKCEVCQKKLCSFGTLKSHLNLHMKFFPHRCEVCPKQYAAKNILTRHKKTKHVNEV
ncbi:PREDICTED: protein odd-skipped-related 1-like [Rhagoletis zephyria]|uniref:protein odd-skipped-related 1-like n=1 Tax=Rhagoletis zephyria TaxID=28612 RepID=UPI00081121CB|nr:PREDICTED: protein odd-skipped-related 1-like [Rhagoletis zephyria]